MVSTAGDKSSLKDGCKMNGAIIDNDKTNTFIRSDVLGYLDALIEHKYERDDNSQETSLTSTSTAEVDADEEYISFGGQEYLRAVNEPIQESDNKSYDTSQEITAREDADEESASIGASVFLNALNKPDEESYDKPPEVKLTSLSHEDPSFTMIDPWKSRHPSLYANRNSLEIQQDDHRTISSTDSFEVIEKGREEPIGLLVSFSCFMDSMDFSGANMSFFPNEEENDGVIEEEVLNENVCSSYAPKIDFSILGTPADDISAGTYVLNPTLMDTLRSHFPYAVRDDNFWLKYSLSDHVSSKNNCAYTNIFYRKLLLLNEFLPPCNSNVFT